ncbi:Ppx/GppA family phosphatase [Paraburkholderia aspalathi]|nr:Ppx/GppA family phosphatase [Paraburkholderia aspalathi]
MAVHNGASGGQSGNNTARNPAESGKRSQNRPVASGSPPPEVARDSERPSSDQRTANSEGRSGEQRKRARRRKRGKSTKPADDAVRAEKPAVQAAGPRAQDEPKQDPKPSGKLSNRRRRARRKKQAAGQPNLHATATAELTGAEHASATNSATGQNASGRQAPRTTNGPRTAPPRPAATSRSGYAPNDTAPLYAALDLGTNNCRLLVASPTRPGQFRVVDAFSRIVRLGEGLSNTGRLSDQAMSRAVEALKICRDKLAAKNVRRSRLIATEACRSAENGESFLQRVRDETGLELEIVDRQTEARLAVSGCGTLVARETDAVVLFDIGGGSSEIALIDVSQRRSPRLAEHIIAWTSLPVGVVTLAERFGGRDVSGESYSAMVGHVADLLGGFGERHQLGKLAQSSRFHLLGTSGTVTTLAGIHLGLERYDRRRVDGMWMESGDVTNMTSQLLSWDFDARVANPCIGADRADLVLAGCAILDAIRNVWPSEKLLVADRGLREGILTELMSRDGAWRHNRAPVTKNRHMS